MYEVNLKNFLKIDFLEGTLVKHKEYYGFNIEFGRGKINKFNFLENTLSITTDNELACLILDLKLSNLYITEREKIYYLEIPDLQYYSMAQKGINIPKKKNYEELIGHHD